MEFDFFFFLFQPLSLRLLASIYIYVQLFFNCHRINKTKMCGARNQTRDLADFYLPVLKK